MAAIAERTSTSNSVQTISDAIVEVRHTINPRLLDTRGRVAEEVLHKMNLEDYTIGADGMEVRTKDGREKAFITVRNVGYVVRECSNAAYLSSRASEFVRNIVQQRVFRDPNHLPISRVGVRGRFLFPFDGRFDELREAVINTFGNPKLELLRELGGQLEDVAYDLVMSEPDGKCHTRVGPMSAEQIVQFYERDDEHLVPDVGLYVDVDCFKEVKSPASEQQLAKVISDFSIKLWHRVHTIQGAVTK